MRKKDDPYFYKTSNDLTLAELDHYNEDQFIYGLSEWIGEEYDWYTFDWKPGMKHQEHIDLLRANSLGVGIPKEHVPSTMLYASVNNLMIGRAHIRHTLNDELKERGGHLGYAVAPRFRSKGYGLLIAQLSLEYCKLIGLERLLITCSSKNKHSIRILQSLKPIEKVNGVDAKNNPIFKYSYKIN